MALLSKELQSELTAGLAVAIRSSLTSLVESDQEIYGVVVMSGMAISSLSLYANTNDNVASQSSMLPSVPSIRLEVWADSWGLRAGWKEFQDLNRKLDELNELLYHNVDVSGQDFRDFVTSVAVDAIREAKIQSVLPPIPNGLLLGLQFVDPSESGQFTIMERVSEAVNSDYWHARVISEVNRVRR